MPGGSQSNEKGDSHVDNDGGDSSSADDDTARKPSDETSTAGSRSQQSSTATRKRRRQGGHVEVSEDQEGSAVIGDAASPPPAAAAAEGGRTSEDNLGSPRPDGIPILQHRWETMFQRLLLFKEKHGHCLVPNRYPEDRSLGAWVSTQRRHFKTSVASGDDEDFVSTPLTAERVRRLQEIGFVWATSDPRHTPWRIRFEQLRAYKERHGDCLVPVGYRENVQLANWVSTQRQYYKAWKEGGQKTRITAERVRLLDSIGMVWEAQRGGHRQHHQEYRYAQPNLMDFMPHHTGGGTTEDQIRAMDAILGSYPHNLLSASHLGGGGAESLLAGAASGTAASRQAEATLSSLLAANSSARSTMLPESVIRSALSAGNFPTNAAIPQPGALWGLGGGPSTAGSSEIGSALSQQVPAALTGHGTTTSSMLSSSPGLLATLRSAAAGAERQEQAAALEAALVAEANRRGRMEAMRMAAAEINNPQALFSAARDQSNALSRIAREGGLNALTASSRSILQQQETRGSAPPSSSAATNRHLLSAQHALLADTLDPLLSGLSRQRGDIMPSALDSRLNPLRGILGSGGTNAGNTLASIAGRLSAGSIPEQDPLRLAAYPRSAATHQALLLEAAERQRVANASMLNSQRASLLSGFNQPRGGILGEASALQLLGRLRTSPAHSGITATSGASMLSRHAEGEASLPTVDAAAPMARQDEASETALPGKSPDDTTEHKRHRR